MKTRFGNIGIIILVLILLLTVGDIFLTYQNLMKANNSDRLVNTAYLINLELQRTMIALVNAETGQRGYLIASDAASFQMYTASYPTIEQHIDRLNELITKDNPASKKTIPLLRQRVKGRIAELQQGIDERNWNNFDATQAFVNEGEAKGTMNGIRNMITSLEVQESNLLTEHRIATENNYIVLFLSTAFTGILSVILILITYFSLNREFAKRTELERNKDEFFNMASHELKTPITSLNIFIHVLMKKIDTNQKKQAKKYLAKIKAQTEKLTVLITDFLDLSRIQTGKMKYHEEEFNLDALIDETIEEIQGTTKNHKIIAKGSCKQLVSADRYRIYQVLVNLITNAVKYSPKGGKIIVTCKKEKNNIIVSVEDQGIGIDTNDQDKIFNRLYQVSTTDAEQQTFPGFGIGLFVSKEIVTYHKGKIWVESIKGKGSVFSFSIPI